MYGLPLIGVDPMIAVSKISMNMACQTCVQVTTVVDYFKISLAKGVRVVIVDPSWPQYKRKKTLRVVVTLKCHELHVNSGCVW